MMDTPTDTIESVSIHPLVLVNLSDGHTRLIAAGEKSGSSSKSRAGVRATGVLLGKHVRNVLEVNHSFELKENPDGSFDRNFGETRLGQFEEIFPSLEVVGWYACDDQLRQSDSQRHTEIVEMFCEKPVFLLLDATKALKNEQSSTGYFETIPITVNVATNVDDSEKLSFKQIPYNFLSTDSERIAVDHVVEHATSSDENSSDILLQHLKALRRSITMLKTRVDVISSYLEASQKGEIPWDARLMRAAAEVCRELPSMQLADYTRALSEEGENVKIVSYMTGVTKSVCHLDDLVKKFKAAYDGSMHAPRKGTFRGPAFASGSLRFV
ncbi:hypothetical protein NDN08_005281 [Rhodosorus marinus]|uniref:JAB1/MPN/MOV34 metalloenzyme domain-containing protein n=1 Tax=Rhodosorus marinus TaxID=101924 RepID=A0AAV8V556_9RHOD|nr:hypothetical protein NDN08_005281 [Rhodosorus marinus]